MSINSATRPFLQQNPATVPVNPTLLLIQKRVFSPCPCKCKNRKAPNNGDGKWSEQYSKWLAYPCRNKHCPRHWRNYAKAHYKKYLKRSEGYKRVYLIRLSCRVQLPKGSKCIAKTVAKLVKAYPESYVLAGIHRGKSGEDHIHLVINTNHEISKEVVKAAYKAHFPAKRIREFDPQHDYSVLLRDWRKSTGLYVLVGSRRSPRKGIPWKGVALNPIRHYGLKKAPATLDNSVIEETLYDRLSTDSTLSTLTGSRINPVIGTNNTQLPYLTYAINAIETNLLLDSVSGLEKYSITIEAYALRASDVRDILNRAKVLLHGWRDEPVRGCKIDGYTQERQEDSERYYGSCSFSLWYDKDAVSSG